MIRFATVCVLFALTFACVHCDDENMEKEIEEKLRLAMCKNQPAVVKYFEKYHACDTMVIKNATLGATMAEYESECYEKIFGEKQEKTFEAEKKLLCDEDSYKKYDMVDNCTEAKAGAERSMQFKNETEGAIDACVNGKFNDEETSELLYMALVFCAQADANITAYIQKQFECQNQLAGPELRALEADCWKQQGETWPENNIGEQTKLVCNDVFKYMEAMLCAVKKAAMDPKLTPIMDEFVAKVELCNDADQSE